MTKGTQIVIIMKLILASKSPQRKRILEDMNLNFEVIPAHIDEHHDGHEAPEMIVKSIALRKAQEIAKTHPKSWVIGCDTIVVSSDGKICLKPENKEDARDTLNRFNNAYCDVFSGLALVNESKKKELVGFEVTRLFFRKVTDEEIENYLELDEWKESSGAMTIEGTAGEWIIKTEGDYWNVVGLPVGLMKKFMTSINFSN